MKKLITITLLTLFISNCGDKVREEITERYDDGKKKTIMKFKGSGSEEVMVEKVTYGKSGDTLFWEKPLEDFYYEKVREDITERYDDGKMKTLMKFIGEGSEEVMVEKISYSKSGDTLILEFPPLNKKMVKKYYRNGNLMKQGWYLDGMEDRKWTYYDENGKIFGEGWYDYGRNSNGLFVDFYENGQIEKVIRYKDGRKDGKRILLQWTIR